MRRYAFTIWTWDSNDPFGANSANSDPDGDSVSFTYNVRPPEQYFDSESVMYYNHSDRRKSLWDRDYDHAVGRYATRDPIGLKGGLNTFGYVGGEPNLQSDSLGLANGSAVGSLNPKLKDTNVKYCSMNFSEMVNRNPHWYLKTSSGARYEFNTSGDPSIPYQILYLRQPGRFQEYREKGIAEREVCEPV